jgi:hypothetical protein
VQRSLATCDRKKCRFSHSWKAFFICYFDKQINFKGSLKFPKAGKLLCWVLTYPGTHDTSAMAVEKTWGPGFVELVFFNRKMQEYDIVRLMHLGREFL